MNNVAESRACFEQAVHLLRNGAADQAERLCREYLDQDPSDPNLLDLLGAILLRQQRPDQAEPFLRRAVKIAPGFAQAHEDLGAALLGIGQSDAGITSLRRAVDINPRQESAWAKLGHALAQAGRHTEADQAYEAMFKLSPDKGELAEALEHFRHGRMREAEKLAREVARRNPDDVNALRLLAKLAAAASQWEDAERLLRRVTGLAPDFVEAWHELSAALKEQDKLEEALECLRQTLLLDENNAQTQFLLASTLALAARPHEAVRVYERALELRPNQPGALLGLGHVLKTVGRQEDGIRAYREALRQRPGFGEVWWSLANLKTYRFGDDEIREMEQGLEQGGLDDDSEVHFCFALAKAWEDRQEWDRSFGYYQRANTKNRMRVAYDPVQTEVMHDRIIEVFNAEFLREKSGQGDMDPAPIFIVGLPRSGSTLIEQILASHSQVEGTSELPDLGKLATSLNRRGGGLSYPDAVKRLSARELQELGRAYIGRTLRHRSGRPYFTDKMPNNFPSIGFLHLILPNAKIINARRNPMDACFGCYKQHFAKGQTFTYDLVELGEFYLEYQRMMDHWHSVLPGRVLDIQYEDMVADQERQTRRLLEYCGLPWEDACLAFYQTDRAVRTASSEQVRQPIYDKSINHWKHFEQHLQPLLEVLQPIL